MFKSYKFYFSLIFSIYIFNLSLFSIDITKDITDTLSTTLNTTNAIKVSDLKIPKSVGWISRFIWSLDDSLLAAYFHKTLLIYEIENKKIILKKSYPKIITAIDWSSKDYIAIGFLDGSIEIYNFNNNLNKITELKTQEDEKVQQLCWSPDGKYLVSYSKSSKCFITDCNYNYNLNNSELCKTDTFDNSSVLMIWNLEAPNTNKLYKKIFLNNNISFIDWSLCGNYLALAENIFENGFLKIIYNYITNTIKNINLNSANKSFLKILKPFESDPINPIFTHNFEQEAQIIKLKWSQQNSAFAVLLKGGIIKIYSLTPQTINYNNPKIQPSNFTFLFNNKYLVASLKNRLEFIDVTNGSKFVRKINLSSIDQIISARKSLKIAATILSNNGQKLKILDLSKIKNIN